MRAPMPPAARRQCCTLARRGGHSLSTTDVSHATSFPIVCIVSIHVLSSTRMLRAWVIHSIPEQGFADRRPAFLVSLSPGKPAVPPLVFPGPHKVSFFFFLNNPAPPKISTLPLPASLPT